MLAFVLIAGLAASPVLPIAPGDSTPRPARTLAELRRQLDSIRTKYRVPGVGVALVTRDSILWAGGLGLADLATHRPVTAETHFRVGSISKTFVALGILRLMEQGKLTLDTPVRQIIPDVRIDNPWEATRPITVANLLEHTAGFDDMRFNEMYVSGKAPDLPMGEVLAINPGSRRVRWEPGTRMSYSNPGYGVAGHLLEKVAGMPYDRYLRDSIIAPLGMTTASFELTDADTAALAQGYSGTKPKPVGYPHIYHRPAGNLHCSPLELARLVRMFLHRGAIESVRIISPQTVDRMERTETTSLAARGVKNGYGLANYYSFEFQVPTHGHDGGIDGFLSDYQYSAEAGVGWVVLVNGGEDAGYGELVKAVGRFMLRDVAAPALPMISPSTDLARYVGYYRPAAPRSQLFAIALDLVGGVRVTQRGDTLFQGPVLGKAEALVPASAATFRLAKRPAADRAFIEGTGGKLIFASGGDYWERASLVPFILRLGGLVVALALMVAALAYGLGWLPNRLRGRLSPGPATAVRAWPLAAVASAVGFVVLAVKYGASHGATLNPASGGMFAASLIFPLVSVVALVKTVRAKSVEAGPLARRFGIMVAVACLGVAAWLGAYGFLGLRTWRY